MLEVKIALLHPKARVPTYGTDGAAGLDLYAAEDAMIGEGLPTLVDTGVAIELPAGYEAQVRGRSGLARAGTMVATGTVDSDYRGPVKVNMWQTVGSRLVRAGDRIAQLVIAPVPRISFVQVEMSQLSDTDRGGAGHGSTGR